MGAAECSLVCDFETLGVSRDSIVLSGAAICFQGDKILWKQYAEFDVLEQIYQGGLIDKQTVDWWKRTDLTEFDRLIFDSQSHNLHEWVSLAKSSIDSHDLKIKEFWSRGHMDFEIFNYHLQNPLEYYVFRDIRTLDSLKLAKMKPNEHNAMRDCENELEYLQEVLRICRGLKQQESETDALVSEPVGIPLVF